MKLIARVLTAALVVLAFATNVPIARAEGGSGLCLQGAATVFDSGTLLSGQAGTSSMQGGMLHGARVESAQGSMLHGRAGSESAQGSFLRGQAGVFDSGTLTGGIRTASLNTGINGGKMYAGDGRMAPLSGRNSSSGLTARTKQLMFKAFAEMTCVEYNQLQANSYSVEYNYRPISFDQTLALPGFYGKSVQVFTDGKRLVAIDPRSLETWVADARADVTRRSNWRKLTHVK